MSAVTKVKSFSIMKSLLAKLEDPNLLEMTTETMLISSQSQIVNVALKEWFDNHTYIDSETGELIVNGYTKQNNVEQVNDASRDNWNPYH